MGKINYYKYNGNLEKSEELNEDNLKHTNGMLLKCLLNDNTEVIGYADTYRTHEKESYDGEVHDYINLWTWDNIDEEKHILIGNEETKFDQTFKKVEISKLKDIEAIVYSNPRWGGKITNKFEFHK